MASDTPETPDERFTAPAAAPADTMPDDALAASLRGFGPLGIFAILAVLLGNALFTPLSALLVLGWVHLSRTPWREIGYVRPRSWPLTIVLGIVSGVAFKFAMKAIVMPLLGAPPVNQAFHYLAGNTAALPGAIFMMIVVAGFGEETMFRGYFFERLGKLFGRGAWAKTLIVVLTSVVFGAEHYAVQGLPGAEQATITGLVMGTIMMVTGQIWFLMILHAAFDLTAVWMIYYGLETRIAQAFFR